jgi:hypothetical protein
MLELKSSLLPGSEGSLCTVKVDTNRVDRGLNQTSLGFPLVWLES